MMNGRGDGYASRKQYYVVSRRVNVAFKVVLVKRSHLMLFGRLAQRLYPAIGYRWVIARARMRVYVHHRSCVLVA